MKFGFVAQVDAGLLTRTKEAWFKQLEENPENTSSTYYRAGLDYCERAVAGEVLTHDSGGCVCGVIENGQDSAAALLIVSHAKNKSFLKMLDIYVQPNLNLADAEPNYPELAWIAATAIVGCLDLTYEQFPSDQLKVHTAFPLDKAFMSGLTAVMFGKGGKSEWADLYDVDSHGNWVVLTKKPGADGNHAASPFRRISPSDQ